MVIQEEGPPTAGRPNPAILVSLFLILFLYLAAACNVVLPWYSYSVHGVTHLLVLSFTTGLGLFCYCACCCVDPGRVPKDWQPEAEQPIPLEVKSSGGYRFCTKCNTYKPPRTHHCRHCQRCVTRMDHHCVWVNSCIGHGNVRAFILMCLYLAAAAVHATYLLYRYDLHMLSILWGPGAADGAAAAGLLGGAAAGGAVGAAGAGAEGAAVGAVPGAWRGPFWLHAAAQVAASAVALPITLALLILLVWNLGLLLRNMTTIEYHEGVRLQLLAAGGGDGGGGASASASTAAGAAAAAAGVVAGLANGSVLKLTPSAASLAGEAQAGAASGGAGGALSALSRQASWQHLPQAGGAAPSQHGQHGAAPQQLQKPVPVLKYKGGSRHPYDLGWHANLTAVFGDGWELLWCLPLRFAAMGDGLSFPMQGGGRRRPQEKGAAPV